MGVSSAPKPASPAPEQRRGRSREIESWLLPLLRQTASEDIVSLAFEPLKRGGVVAEVFRVVPRAADNDKLPGLVVKIVHPGEPQSGFLHDREVNFYAAVHPALNLPGPRVFFSGCRPATRDRVVIMEDLQGFRIPLRTHRWTVAEAAAMVRAYARFHHPVVDPGDDPAPWLFSIRALDFESGETLALTEDLVRRGVWPPLPGLPDLLDWVAEAARPIEGAPLSYVHGDVYPPNIALPKDPSGDAVLIDWDMVGVGPAELDLAFMFLQPFGSADDLNRAAVLDMYWAERTRLAAPVSPAVDRVPDSDSARHSAGHVPDEPAFTHLPAPAERARRQRFADALWGLYLVPVAHRSVFKPFDPGSPPDIYWGSMRGVLHGWLERLSK